MKELFWPIRTGATLVDIWSVAHLCAFFVLGMNAQAIGLTLAVGFGGAFCTALLVGIGWELLEAHLESLEASKPPEYRRRIRHPERWKNRWIGDPAVDLAGFALGLWAFTLQ